MKRPLILHIGTPKTGTTSLQGIFAKNRVNLMKQGVVYPEAFGNINLIKIALAFGKFKEGDRFASRHGIKSKQDQQALANAIDRAWIEEEKKINRDATVFVSNEHLYTRIHEKGLFKLRDWLSIHFEPISIFVGLRPQVDLLVSNASQMARQGKFISKDFFCDINKAVSGRFLNYENGLRPWEGVFGNDAINPIPLNRNENIVDFFKRELGNVILDENVNYKKNPSLGVEAIAESNRIIVHKGVQNISKHAKYLNALPKGEPLQVGADIAKEITMKFESSNKNLVNNFDGLIYSDFLPNLKKYSFPSNLDRLEGN